MRRRTSRSLEQERTDTDGEVLPREVNDQGMAPLIVDILSTYINFQLLNCNAYGSTVSLFALILSQQRSKGTLIKSSAPVSK
jgi:hypothetical protein